MICTTITHQPGSLVIICNITCCCKLFFFNFFSIINNMSLLPLLTSFILTNFFTMAKLIARSTFYIWPLPIKIFLWGFFYYSKDMDDNFLSYLHLRCFHHCSSLSLFISRLLFPFIVYMLVLYFYAKSIFYYCLLYPYCFSILLSLKSMHKVY